VTRSNQTTHQINETLDAIVDKAGWKPEQRNLGWLVMRDIQSLPAVEKKLAKHPEFQERYDLACHK